MAHGDAVYEEMTTTHSINVLSALSPHASKAQQSVSPSQRHCYPAVPFLQRACFPSLGLFLHLLTERELLKEQLPLFIVCLFFETESCVSQVGLESYVAEDEPDILILLPVSEVLCWESDLGI